MGLPSVALAEEGPGFAALRRGKPTGLTGLTGWSANRGGGSQGGQSCAFPPLKSPFISSEGRIPSDFPAPAGGQP